VFAVAPVFLTATIVAFAAGSGPVREVGTVGRALKWPTLLLLAVLAVGSLAMRKPKGRVDAVSWTLVGALGILALASSAWSVDPRVSAQRGASFVLLIVAAAALGRSAVADRRTIQRILLATLAGAVVVAALGVLVLLVDRQAALVFAPNSMFGRRYLAFAGNPDTDSILFAIALPLALWLWTLCRSTRERAATVAIVVLLAGSIVASASRGALLGAVAGTAAYVIAVKVRRVVLPFAVTLLPVVFAAVAFGVAAAGSPSSPGIPSGVGRLIDEIGWGKPVPSSFLDTLTGSSGRLEAWEGAVAQGNQRPVVGYGFGTEDRVFIDRYQFFQGSRPENSYIGMYLQLGALGTVLLLALVVRLAVVCRRSLGRLASREAAACIAALTAAFTIGVVQSYLYAVGNVATVSVWVLALLAASMNPVERG
jgi:O-antigen ligase